MSRTGDVRHALHRRKRTLQTATRRSELLWTSTFNGPRRAMAVYDRRHDQPTLDAVVDTLRADGVVTTDIASLLGDHDDAYRKVLAAAQEWVAGLGPDLRPGEDGLNKGYVMHAVADPVEVPFARGAVTAPDPFAALALQPQILEVIRRYMRIVPRLVSYDVWLNLPTEHERYSQLWHRDPEDRKILKLFVTLDEVGPAQGPFSYARGSHPAGGGFHRNGRDRFEPRVGTEQRLSDQAMADISDPADWVRLEGPAGSVAIADTAGFHRGSWRTAPRLMYTATFASAVAKIR